MTIQIHKIAYYYSKRIDGFLTGYKMCTVALECNKKCNAKKTLQFKYNGRLV